MSIRNHSLALTSAIALALALAASPALASDASPVVKGEATQSKAEDGETTPRMDYHNATTRPDDASAPRTKYDGSRTETNADGTPKMNFDGSPKTTRDPLTQADAQLRRTDGSDDVSPEISNARLESQIWTTYALSPSLRGNDLKVTVLDGKATLTGVVEEDVNKNLAAQIAMGVEGVNDVDNQIVVKSDYQPTVRAGERQYGAKIDDASTSAAVRSKLSWSQRGGNQTADVTTVDGKVTLKGNVTSNEEKAYFTRLAMNTQGVRSVDNKMVIVDPAKADGMSTTDTTVAAIADSWITTKVKSTFMYSSNVNSSNISVSTVGGVVTLTGSVASGAERALAIELAQNVRGVKSVESTSLAFTPFDEVASTPSGG